MNKGILSILLLALAVFAPMAFSQTMMQNAEAEQIYHEEELIDLTNDMVLPSEDGVEKESVVKPVVKKTPVKPTEPWMEIPEALRIFAEQYGVSEKELQASMQGGQGPQDNPNWFLITTDDTDKILWGQHWGNFWKGTMYFDNQLEGYAFGGYQPIGNQPWGKDAGIWWGWFYEPGNLNKGGWYGGIYGVNSGEKQWQLWDISKPVNQWHKGVLKGPAYKLFE